MCDKDLGGKKAYLDPTDEVKQEGNVLENIPMELTSNSFFGVLLRTCKHI